MTASRTRENMRTTLNHAALETSMRFVISVCALFCATPLFAQDTMAVAAPAWSTGQAGEVSFAHATGETGLAATLGFQKGQSSAELVITGVWPTKPLILRLWVAYGNGRRVPVDTYRHAEIIEVQGKPAYKLNLTRAALRPLKGGDTLVIEDLTRRAMIPLTGSSAAIKAAEAKAEL
jgi:hypothetical protein